MRYFLFFTLWALHVSLFANTLELSDAQKRYLADKKVIRMCVDPEWEPFEKINERGQHVGIAADLVRLVAQRLSVNMELVETKTWQESLEASKNKRCDILSLVNQSPKRDQWLIYTDPILEDATVLIGREEHDDIVKLASLHDQTIVLLKDTSMLEYVEKHYPKLTIIPVNSEEAAFGLVERKKADVTLRPLIIAAYTIKKENFLNLKIVGTAPELNNKLRIGIHKDEPMLRDILDIGVTSITKEEREQIISKYVILTLKTHAKTYFWLIYSSIGLLILTTLVLFINRRLKQTIEKEVQKNLVQAKQAALGTLMANISHQWRDSLTKISYINLGLRAHVEQNKDILPDMLDKNTKEIEQTIDFMSETMQNFLEYYKPSDKIQLFHVEDSIKAVVTILDTRIKNLDVDIVFNITSDANIQGIRNEWMQVWMNILSNTLNAADKNAIKNPRMIISISDISIQFSDNCGGIKEKSLNNLNHEIYSGLGIKMCKDIVAKYGKNLDIYNENNGMVISISFKKR